MAERYTSYAKRESLRQEIEDTDRIIRRQNIVDGSGFVHSGEDAAKQISSAQLQTMAKENEHQKRRLEEMTPPTLAELEKRGVNPKRVVERCEQLGEFLEKGGSQFPGMLSTRQDKECPPGAVDLNLLDQKMRKQYNVTPTGEIVKVDKQKGQQSCLEEWKDLRRIIYQEMEGDMPNIANPEILRPETKDENNSLINYTRRTYRSPAVNLTPEEYEERIGIEGLSDTQKMVHEMEKKGPIKTPSIDESMRRLYMREEATDVPKIINRHKNGWTEFEDGFKVQAGTVEKAQEAWRKEHGG